MLSYFHRTSVYSEVVMWRGQEAWVGGLLCLYRGVGIFSIRLIIHLISADAISPS